VRQRRALAARYSELLEGIAEVTIPHEPSWARTNWQSYCLVLPPYCDQRRVMQGMLDAGIATRRGVMSAHREPAYAAEPWRSAGPLDVSEEMTRRGLILPLYVGMTDEAQVRVAAALADALEDEEHRR
jgi:dTDP-4-amino-4,6-dideoxygalactose transaminase